MPNLCRNTAVLRVVVTIQLCAVIISLLMNTGDFAQRLGLVSLYLQWIGLSSTAVLCKLRGVINRQSELLKVLMIGAIVFITFAVTESLTQMLLNSAGFDWHEFFVRSGAMLIVLILVLQLFTMVTLLDERGRIETEARVQALQSRIRPHFLFNSLNTISELTATEPDKAEEAIDSLSLLFRAGLESDVSFHSLDNELNLCRRYLGLEHWRLEDKLNVQWHIDVVNPRAHWVPKLILQPLIENAVVHGALADGGVEISIDIRETKKDLSLVVENKVELNTESSHKDGNGMAVENIRERLVVLYDDKQTFQVKATADLYRVLMRFPKQRPTGAS